MTIHYKINVAKDYATIKTDCLVLGYFSDQARWPGSLPASTRKQLSQLQKSGDLTAAAGRSLWLYQPAGMVAKRLLLVGCGQTKDWDQRAYGKFLDTSAARLLDSPAKTAALAIPRAVPKKSALWQASQLAKTVTAAGYRYTETRSKPAATAVLRRLNLLQASNRDQALAKQGLQQGYAIGSAINTARELGDLPGNICTPDYLAQRARKIARNQDKVVTTVLDEKKMESLGMGALLSVSHGSDQAARLISIDYRGGKKDQPPVVLVGKGITFDSGGISLKPGAKMDEMKYDMCGAASVIGTMQAIVALQAPINVVGIVPASENLPSGGATKPGDIVTSMAGITIEVLNTDAEGRLVLCDALTYAGKYKPRAVIDIATLTGACIVALGNHNAGLLGNHQPLADQLLKAGSSSGDSAWQLPLGPEYQKQLHSNFADLANIGGPAAGTITAACFLSRFTEDFHWAHLDIAGVAWNQGANKGATGRPVAMLMEYLLHHAD
jgi:leucyl aminopeptidase